MVKDTKPLIGYHSIGFLIITIVSSITIPLGSSSHGKIITGVLPFGHVTGQNCHSNRSYWSYHSQSWVKMRCRMTSKDHPNLRWTWGHWAEHLRSPTLKYQFWVGRKMWKRIMVSLENEWKWSTFLGFPHDFLILFGGVTGDLPLVMPSHPSGFRPSPQSPCPGDPNAWQWQSHVEDVGGLYPLGYSTWTIAE